MLPPCDSIVPYRSVPPTIGLWIIGCRKEGVRQSHVWKEPSTRYRSAAVNFLAFACNDLAR